MSAFPRKVHCMTSAGKNSEGDMQQPVGLLAKAVFIMHLSSEELNSIPMVSENFF